VRLYTSHRLERSAASDGPSARELLAAYGENNLARQRFRWAAARLSAGQRQYRPGHTVWVARPPNVRSTQRATSPQRRCFRPARS